jgi:hypothetical protein
VEVEAGRWEVEREEGGGGRREEEEKEKGAKANAGPSPRGEENKLSGL